MNGNIGLFFGFIQTNWHILSLLISSLFLLMMNTKDISSLKTDTVKKSDLQLIDQKVDNLKEDLKEMKQQMNFLYQEELKKHK
jgi:hypothetical protein